MNRRKFIKIIGGTSVVAGGSYLVLTDFYDVVEKIIRQELSYLPIGEDVFASFIADVRKEKAITQFGFSKEWFIRTHFLVGGMGKQILPYRYKYLQYQEQILATFLLSTNFFFNKMDETKPIQYVELYHPYKRACSNPFSSIYYNNFQLPV
ncbi:MAG: hypothetical protein AAF944_26930 [Bacteroidota bacterium]